MHDADGDSLSLSAVSHARGGTLSLKNGLYTFVPDADYYGPAGFDYN